MTATARLTPSLPSRLPSPAAHGSPTLHTLPPIAGDACDAAGEPPTRSGPLGAPLPARIVVLFPPHPTKWRQRLGEGIAVHLSDGAAVWGRTAHSDAAGALARVNALLSAGYPLAFQSAVRELLAAAGAAGAPEFVAPLVARWEDR